MLIELLITLLLLSVIPLTVTWFAAKPLWIGRFIGRHYVWYPVSWRCDDYSVCLIKKLPDGKTMYHDGLDWHIIDWDLAIPITWKEDDE